MLDTAKQKSIQERFAAIRSLSKHDLVTEIERSTLNIKQAGKGSFFEYLGKTYMTKDLSRYEETSDDYKRKAGYVVTELTCLCLETGETVYFEWEFDDELEVAMTLDRLSFKHLTDDDGNPIDEDDLDEIAETRDTVVAKKETFFFEDDYAAVYERGGKEEPLYLYEFENESGTLFLTIEEWSGNGREDYQIYLSSPVEPSHITLITKQEV